MFSLVFLVQLTLLTHTHIPYVELLCCCLWKRFCWQLRWYSGFAPAGRHSGSELAGSGSPGSGFGPVSAFDSV